jgi:hypothetical protein
VIDLAIGEPIRRVEVHERFGGSRQGGICPAPKSSSILLFTDPNRGPENGYQDGWGDDGCYYYSGQGREGDQVMDKNNLAVLRHVQDRRELHLFESVKGQRSFVQRVGQFVLSPDDPWFSVDAPDQNGEIRRMFVFRLLPAGETLLPIDFSAPKPSSKLTVEYVPLEEHNTERMAINPQRKPYEAERREADLLKAFRKHLEALGHTVGRNKIIPHGELHPLYTDLHDRTDNVLVEAKGSVTREAIRMAVGQLLDYRRYLHPRPSLAVLVPDQPRSDLVDYCAAETIATVWRSNDSFETHAPPSSAEE